MTWGKFWHDLTGPYPYEYPHERPISPRRYKIELFKSGSKWSSRIRHRNGKIIWSTTAQLYSRKQDAWHVARRFSRATGVPLKEIDMPKVGSGKSAKHFTYGAKGQAAAKKYAEKTGKPLTKKRAK